MFSSYSQLQVSVQSNRFLFQVCYVPVELILGLAKKDEEEEEGKKNLKKSLKKKRKRRREEFQRFQFLRYSF